MHESREPSRFVRLMKAWIGAERLVHRGVTGVSGVLSGYAMASLPLRELSRFSIEAGDRPGTRARAALHDWEEQWYERALPRAPADVLLTAAGGGREARWLVERGYAVDAFEPAPAAYRALRDAGCRRCWPIDYEAFVDGGGPSERAKYDAVILGWGSLSCVLDGDLAEALLRKCDRLAPEGPILASYWRPLPSGRTSRATRLGERLARGLGTARREVTGELSFASHAGFLRCFSRAEIESLGRAVARRAEHGVGSYAHVTWTPSR